MLVKKILLITGFIILAWCFGTVEQSEGATPKQKIAAEVQAQLKALPPNERLTVIVVLVAQEDLSQTTDSSPVPEDILHRLQTQAQDSQRAIRAFLTARMAQGVVSQIIPFWVFNGLSITASAEVIDELAARSDVRAIESDALPIVPHFKGFTAPFPFPPETNLSVIHAPELWAMGYTGQGIVVANMDSGVDVAHPDLVTRWRGGTNSWYDPYNQHPTTPTDLSGHGTWTMGVMVGGDAGGTSIGVAPGAQWIAVKIFNDAGNATATAIHQGFQWLLDPDGDPNTPDAPQVVNNSWSYGGPGCNLAFQPDLQVLRAVGIVPVFSAGNYGPSGSTSVSPANYPEAFAVGNTNNSDQLYFESSRGPSACGEASTIYPELVAPGVAIYTTDLFGFYTQATGTSLAAPHVSGALALLLSAFPALSPVEQEDALINSALDLGITGPDNDYGNGRLDIFAAYQSLIQSPTLTPTNTPTETETATLTPTPTFSLTPSVTLTNTDTLTPTPTITPSDTSEPTFTPTLTSIPTHTTAPTHTLTPTSSSTITPPPNLTLTPTATIVNKSEGMAYLPIIFR